MILWDEQPRFYEVLGQTGFTGSLFGAQNPSRFWFRPRLTNLSDLLNRLEFI